MNVRLTVQITSIKNQVKRYSYECYNRFLTLFLWKLKWNTEKIINQKVWLKFCQRRKRKAYLSFHHKDFYSSSFKIRRRKKKRFTEQKQRPILRHPRVSVKTDISDSFCVSSLSEWNKSRSNRNNKFICFTLKWFSAFLPLGM